MKSAKRRNLDEKYGFGGKKPRPEVGYARVALQSAVSLPKTNLAPRKRSKQNDKSSTHDMSASPWVRSLFQPSRKTLSISDLCLVPREEAGARAARAEEKARAKAWLLWRAERAEWPRQQRL